MEIGTGWIGWTEEQTLQTSMQVIEIAYKGRLKMLQHVRPGGGAPAASQVPAPEPTGPPMTSKLFRAIFGKNK